MQRLSCVTLRLAGWEPAIPSCHVKLFADVCIDFLVTPRVAVSAPSFSPFGFCCFFPTALLLALGKSFFRLLRLLFGYERTNESLWYGNMQSKGVLPYVYKFDVYVRDRSIKEWITKAF